MVEKLQRIIGSYLKRQKSQGTSAGQLRHIEKVIAQREKAINNLIQALKLAEDVGPLLAELKKCESEKRELELSRRGLTEINKNEPSIPSQQEIQRMTASFLLQFKQVLQERPMEMQRGVVRQVVERIDLHQEEGLKRANVLMRIIPKTAEFESVYSQFVLSGPCRT